MCPLRRSVVRRIGVCAREPCCVPQRCGVEFCIDEIFEFARVGTVVGGTLVQGTLRPGMTLHLGPDAAGPP